MDKKNSSGQILLLVLLSIATVTIVVLSIASRTITEVQVTNVEDESLRAFSAAEAGVESVLINEVGVGDTETGELSVGPITPSEPAESTYTAEVSAYPEENPRFLYPNELYGNQTATFWFAEHDASGDIDESCSGGTCYTNRYLWICWGEDGTPRNQQSTPAVVLTVVYNGGGGDYEVLRSTYDPLGGGANRNYENNFLSSAFNPGNNCNFEEENLEWGERVDLSPLTNGELIFANLKILYNGSTPHSVGFYNPSGNSVPAQGRQIESTGFSGDATRKVEVYALYPVVPSIFDNAIYSGDEIR